MTFALLLSGNGAKLISCLTKIYLQPPKNVWRLKITSKQERRASKK